MQCTSVKATSWDKIPATILELIKEKIDKNETLTLDEINISQNELKEIKGIL